MPGRRVQAQHPAVANTVLNNVDFIQRLPADALDQVYEGRTMLQWAVASGADADGTLSALAHGIVDGW